MSQLDLRLANYNEIKDAISEHCAIVLAALSKYGPCTSTELSDKIAWKVTSTRPRLSDLKKKGLIQPTGERRNHEHVFTVLAA